MACGARFCQGNTHWIYASRVRHYSKSFTFFTVEVFASDSSWKNEFWEQHLNISSRFKTILWKKADLNMTSTCGATSVFALYNCRHDHGRPDQSFSRINAHLAVISCLTIESFVHEVQHAYMTNPTLTLMKRSLNFHQWQESSFSKFHSAISVTGNLPQVNDPTMISVGTKVMAMLLLQYSQSDMH